MTRLVLSVMTAGLIAASSALAASWREPALQSVLTNEVMEARFQAGWLYALKHLDGGAALMQGTPDTLPAQPQLLGTNYGHLMEIDLDACLVEQDVGDQALTTRYRAPDGTRWQFTWSIEPGRGDLVLRASAQAVEPVTQFRLAIADCDISAHRLVRVNHLGVGEQVRAPWKGSFGDVRPGGPAGISWSTA